MKTLILTLAYFPFTTFGQTDTTKNKLKYEYQVCVHYKENYKPTLIKNEIKGIADTTVVNIDGQIYDYNNDPVPYAIYVFDNHKDSKGKGGLADSSGHFKVSLHADKYELKVRSVG